MVPSLDPGLLKDLTEAKADVARHGIVIIRTIETELEPTIMAAAKDSMESSPRKLERMKEDDLNELLERLRASVMDSVKELRELYIRLLAKLGTEYIGDLVKELDGIGGLFTWDRIRQTSEHANEILAEAGFAPVDLRGPTDVSESFDLELDEKWAAAFARFKGLAETTSGRLQEMEKAGPVPARARKGSRRR